MTNRFDVRLHPDDVRWAAAEGMSETVIAAVLLLHESSVKEIAAELSAAELEQVIKLVGRSPRVYPPGTLDALKQRREPPQRSTESTRRDVAMEKQHARARSADFAGPAGDPHICEIRRRRLSKRGFQAMANDGLDTRTTNIRCVTPSSRRPASRAATDGTSLSVAVATASWTLSLGRTMICSKPE